ncbi:MAG: PAS domain-containing sensor histidine kinase [Verrucomicrobiota bacterium]
MDNSTSVAQSSGLGGQAQLDRFLTVSKDLFCVFDPQGRFQYANPAFEKLLGFGQTELAGKSLLSLVPPAEAPAASAEFRRLAEGAQHAQIECQCRGKNGAFHWIDWSFSLDPDLPDRIYATGRDSTGRVESATELTKDRELLRVLLSELPETFYFKDLKSRFIRVSRSKAEQALKILRARFAQENPGVAESAFPAHLASIDSITTWLLGKTDFDVYTEERARRSFDEEQSIVETGQPVIGRVERAQSPDGKSRWSIVTKMRWRDPAGHIIGTYGMSQDISAIKNAESELEKTHRELAESSRLAGMAEMATGVLHNVGNVLNSVNVASTCLAESLKKSRASMLAKVVELFRENQANLAEFLTSDAKGKQIPTYLAKLSEQLINEHQSALSELASLQKNIEHIRDIVTMQQNCAKMSGITETLKVADLVDDVLRVNEHALSRHQIEVIRQIEGDPVVTVDRHKTLQILVNLVRNAKQACEAAENPNKRLTIRANNGGDEVRITVSDTGVGIAPENLARVFTHGFTTKKDGHGFGLHSGVLAAKDMGGTLTVHSDGPGTGATFTLTLPVKPRETKPRP